MKPSDVVGFIVCGATLLLMWSVAAVIGFSVLPMLIRDKSFGQVVIMGLVGILVLLVAIGGSLWIVGL